MAQGESHGHPFRTLAAAPPALLLFLPESLTISRLAEHVGRRFS